MSGYELMPADNDGRDEPEPKADEPRGPMSMAERAALGGQARARRYEQFREVPSNWPVLWDADGDDAAARRRAAAEAKANAKTPRAK
jgi:hypothetical protein